MMINKRLIRTVEKSKKYVIANVLLQWIGLLANIAMMVAISVFFQKLYYGEETGKTYLITVLAVVVSVLVRTVCTISASKMSYLSSKEVKKKLREMIYEKLLRLGISYREKVKTSEVVQVTTEGVEQLETYFGAYLPQFFYAMVAPLTLFLVLSFVNLLSASVLLLCVPLIPVSIALVQTWAKKLLGKYWGQYTALGDTFLENLQGLTTLKIYQSDEFKHEKMNLEAEKFRKITMKVLTMQLNSITIMDFIAYGGAALGILLSVTQFRSGNIQLGESILILLLAADFFLPMRLLGSYFHIAMNGMAATEKIFTILDLEEPPYKEKVVLNDCNISCESLSFSYGEDRVILKNLDMSFPEERFTAIVGESGSGKSTLSGVLIGRNQGYEGKVTMGGVSISEIREESLLQSVTYVTHESYLFKGTVRDNLLMADMNAGEEAMWAALEKVNMADFLREEKGLDTYLLEKASNFSGGQRQRLAMARALLHNSPVYIFDEATSNIDVESETIIMEQIAKLAKTKTVILISHRLANVVQADNIYVLKNGELVGEGTHQKLLEKNPIYKELWDTQQELENYTGGGAR